MQTERSCSEVKPPRVTKPGRSCGVVILTTAVAFVTTVFVHQDRVALGGCPPRAPADPDVLALEHPVPLVATSLRDTGADVQPIGWWRVTRPHWSVVLTVFRSTGTTRHHVPSADPNGADTAIRRRCVDMGPKLKVFAMFLPDGLTTRHPLLVFPSLHRVATGMTSPASTVL